MIIVQLIIDNGIVITLFFNSDLDLILPTNDPYLACDIIDLFLRKRSRPTLKQFPQTKDISLPQVPFELLLCTLLKQSFWEKLIAFNQINTRLVIYLDWPLHPLLGEEKQPIQFQHDQFQDQKNSKNWSFTVYRKIFSRYFLILFLI